MTSAIARVGRLALIALTSATLKSAAVGHWTCHNVLTAANAYIILNAKLAALKTNEL
jgi:hypothetical protein